MPKPVTLRPDVCAAVVRLRARRNEERGEMTIERTVLTAALIGLALVILGLGFPVITRVLASV